MRVCQANLGRGVSVARFVDNLDRMLEAFGPRCVYCLQEIDEADKPDERVILERRTRDTHHMIGGQTAVPILVPKHLRLFSAKIEPACRGLAKVTPNRVVNEVVIQLGPHFAVAVLNLHLPIDDPRAESRRADCVGALTRRANLYAAGVWLSDTNTHHGWPTIVKGEKTVTDAGIDKAKAWAPKGRRLEITERKTVDLTIDGHDAHGARIVWAR